MRGCLWPQLPPPNPSLIDPLRLTCLWMDHCKEITMVSCAMKHLSLCPMGFSNVTFMEGIVGKLYYTFSLSHNLLLQSCVVMGGMFSVISHEVLFCKSIIMRQQRHLLFLVRLCQGINAQDTWVGTRYVIFMCCDQINAVRWDDGNRGYWLFHQLWLIGICSHED